MQMLASPLLASLVSRWPHHKVVYLRRSSCDTVPCHHCVRQQHMLGEGNRDVDGTEAQG